MNSRQRRQDRKRWCYSIVTVARDFDHYSEMWSWLKVRHGARARDCGWRDRSSYLDDSVNYQVTWQFVRERDATEFALRWA
jgi:hypothetical protein